MPKKGKNGGKKGGKRQPQPNMKKGKPPSNGQKPQRNTRTESYRGGKLKKLMTGRRNGELGSDLRFQPVEFVRAAEFTLELKPEDLQHEEMDLSDSDSDESEDTNEPVPITNEVQSPRKTEDTSDKSELVNSTADSKDLDPNSRIDASAELPEQSSVETSTRSSTESPAGSKEDFVDIESESSDTPEVIAETHVQSKPTEMDDTDVEIVSQKASSTPSLQESTPSQPVVEVDSESDISMNSVLGSESDSELEEFIHQQAIDRAPQKSGSEHDGNLSEAESAQEHDRKEPHEDNNEPEYSDSDEDEDSNDESTDENGNYAPQITLDDFEDAYVDDYDESEQLQDYSDNMSELDDDQIFALASGSLYDHEDEDMFDQYDEYDEYFDQLIGDEGGNVSGGNKPNSKGKQPVSDRKKLKRQAREVMHAMKFGKQPPLWREYPDTITVREVLDEIRRFAMQREQQQLAFPPLDTNANWYVSSLAQRHGLTATTEGSNDAKYVRVSLTKRANPYVPDSKLRTLLTRRRTFMRTDTLDAQLKKGKKGAKKDKHGKDVPQAKVRDGHVVGQNATEIGESNFGHKMLKQMGWTEGSGLGRAKEGITAPIPATVKLTKAGLGG